MNMNRAEHVAHFLLRFVAGLLFFQVGSKLVLGWFGPRGLATIVFLITVLADRVPGSSQISGAATATVVLSVVLHGLTARPAAARYADWFAVHGDRHLESAVPVGDPEFRAVH